MLDVGASCSLLVPLGLWILELGIFSQCGYILLPGCSGKPARQNKNRMSLKSFFEEFAARLRDFIVSSSSRPGAADPRIFESLALELFALQFEHNLAYRKICDARRVSPQTIEHWTQIPTVPTTAFKELELSCLPVQERTFSFHSSGTTQQRPSRHFHNAESLAVYEASLWAWFVAHLAASRIPSPPLEERARERRPFRQSRTTTHQRHDEPLAIGDWQLAVLTPSPDQVPHSSLVHMFGTIRLALGANESAFLARVGSDGGWTLDLERTTAALGQFAQNKPPVLLLGTAFSFVHLLDYLAAQNLCFQLPPGSRVVETGGYKGRSRDVPKRELHALITARLAVAPAHIICEYGMSELSSQAYTRASHSSHFLFPPWARAQIISPETGREVREGEAGLIRVFDLANVYSVMAIQTEDLGIRRANGFELLGRATLAEPRGCSLMAV